MTIDERLDRLAERHEALTQSVELLTSDVHRMRGIMDDMMEGIKRLVRVAEIHERRIGHLEDGEQAS